MTKVKINFKQPFKDLDGNAIRDEKGNEFLMSNFIANSLVSQEAKDNILDLFELAKKIKVSDQIELSTADIERIEAILPKTSVLFAAQVKELIINSKK